WRLTLKTVRAHYDRLEEEILRLHPYTTPEILATPIEAGSADYLDWLQREVD
ncbi:divalent-cation tolerance protein CutA, partial [bacterium]|nr:divalent-cation tolerance protein CutA [bacterium]